MRKNLILLAVIGFFSVTTLVSAHQSGCHRWHSCPSDTGSYVCGDLGYTSECGGYSSSYTSPSTPTCPSNSYYDGISSCKCSFGYVVSGNSCVSADNMCHEQLGYSSSYDSLSDSCKCSYGYVIGSSGQCTSGNNVCHAKFGLYSSYNSSNKSCECDSGYTLDDSNQCVQKQNNVYFKLLDVNIDDKQAIIKSESDNRSYLITYGSGCYSSSIQHYKGKKLVVNLGTDFDLDTWDKIVLQDDDETCSITHRERTYEESLETKETSSTYSSNYTPSSVLTCPINSTLNQSDSKCYCNSGYAVLGGACAIKYNQPPSPSPSIDSVDSCTQKLGSHGVVAGQNLCGCAQGYILNELKNSCILKPVETQSVQEIAPHVPKDVSPTPPTKKETPKTKAGLVKKDNSTSTPESQRLSTSLTATSTTSTQDTTKPSLVKKISLWFKNIF